MKGEAALKAAMMAIPQRIRDEVSLEMERQADRVVADMNAMKPLPNIAIDWTWGDAPAGTVSLGRVRNYTYARMSITIYATATKNGQPFKAIAKWFEHGTKERFHKSGKSVGRIDDQPYFFPAWRANKTRVKGALTRAVKRAVRQA